MEEFILKDRRLKYSSKKVKKILHSIAEEKFGTLYDEEKISWGLYDNLDCKDIEIANIAYSFFKKNTRLTMKQRAKDNFTQNLLLDIDKYDDMSDEEAIEEVLYDALMNYDALWLQAIQAGMPLETNIDSGILTSIYDEDYNPANYRDAE